MASVESKFPEYAKAGVSVKEFSRYYSMGGTAKKLKGQYASYLSEQEAGKAEEVFSAYQNLPIPSIVVVPFTTESTGFATRALGESLKMAMGVDILQNN